MDPVALPPFSQPMKLNHLKHALTALSERSQTSLDLLSTHLKMAEDRAEAAQRSLEGIDARLARMLADLTVEPETTSTTAEGSLPLEAKLDLLERALEAASAGSKRS